MRETIVVGAGISGLTAAWHLHRAGRDVLLVDAQPRVGGAIQTEHRDGFLLEKGPYNVIVRDPAFEELLSGLSDRAQVVTASDRAKNRFIYRRGRLYAVPTGPIPFLRSPLLSLPGRLRALRGLFLSARGRGGETTIEEFAARRFGQEVADTIVSAAIAGILAGDIRRLGAYASFPVLRDFDTKSFSPMGRTMRRIPNMIRKRRDPKLRRKWKGLVSIDVGLGGLCDAIAEELGGGVRTNSRVESLVRGSGRFVLSVREAGGAAETVETTQLILATPAQETARLIESYAPDAARILRTIESASLTVVNLAFRAADVGHPLDGFGFLVPHNEPDFPLMGVLFADSAFPHHAPAGYRLLRCFFGGSRAPDVIERSADELVDTARRSLRDVLGVRGEPVLADVCPYPEAIPQYYLDHLDKVAAIRQDVARLDGLRLAGNYLDGVSINDCVKSGKRVAHEVLAASSSARSPSVREKGVSHAVTV